MTSSSLSTVPGVESHKVSNEPPRPLIEIGWIIAGKMEDLDRQATERARAETNAWLRETFAEFDWKMPLLEREEIVSAPRVESVELLDDGVTERNLRRWDLTLIITAADLISHYKNDALSAVSRSLQAAVISTLRIDPGAYHKDLPSELRIAAMAARIRALVLHLVGHLGGLEHDENGESFMAEFETVEDLDRPSRLSDEQVRELSVGLREVADRRLEEQPQVRRMRAPRFYLQATWINRRQIAKAVLQAKPWQFPFRLSRLTTAAASTVLVLMISAEAWELGLNQSPSALTGFATLAMTLTTVYVLTRQRLFVRREHARLSEQTVVTNVSTFAIVAAGMMTTFVLLAAATVAFGYFAFKPALVENWAPSAENTSDGWARGRLAVFVASVGILIGALGASFEQQSYFRHITHVDEEI